MGDVGMGIAYLCCCCCKLDSFDVRYLHTFPLLQALEVAQIHQSLTRRNVVQDVTSQIIARRKLIVTSLLEIIRGIRVASFTSSHPTLGGWAYPIQTQPTSLILQTVCQENPNSLNRGYLDRVRICATLPFLISEAGEHFLRQARRLA